MGFYKNGSGFERRFGRRGDCPKQATSNMSFTRAKHPMIFIFLFLRTLPECSVKETSMTCLHFQSNRFVVLTVLNARSNSSNRFEYIQKTKNNQNGLIIQNIQKVCSTFKTTKIIKMVCLFKNKPV